MRKTPVLAALGLLTAALGGGAGCDGQDALVGSSGSQAQSAGGSSASDSNVVSTFTYYADQIHFVPDNERTDRCLPRPLSPDVDGTVPCAILSALPSGTECNCARPGLLAVPPEIQEAAHRQLASTGLCDAEGAGPCSDYCVCEVLPARDSRLTECLTALAPSPGEIGWCFISEEQGNPALIEACPASSPKQLLRLVGTDFLQEAQQFLLQCMLGTSVEQPAPLGVPDAPLGAPCVPEAERDPTFSGFAVTEVPVEVGSAGCESGVCLVNHFQGRVSCPYGQNEADEPLCFIPGSNASVNVTVQPQLVDRRADANVICSCRCDGPGDGPFCACPAGMECAPLIGDLLLATSDQYTGSYCITAGTAYDPRSPLVGTCTRSTPDSNDGTCGPTPQF